MSVYGIAREDIGRMVVDQRANALGRIPLRDCLDHRIIPVKLAAGPAADVDKGGACDTVATTDQRPAVAANEGAGLVVDAGPPSVEDYQARPFSREAAVPRLAYAQQ